MMDEGIQLQTLCSICYSATGDGHETVTVREKGALGINKASKDPGKSLVVCSGQIVHKECCINYNKHQTIARVYTHTSSSQSEKP